MDVFLLKTAAFHIVDVTDRQERSGIKLGDDRLELRFFQAVDDDEDDVLDISRITALTVQISNAAS